MTISIAPGGPPDPEYILKRKHKRDAWDFYKEPAWASHALFNAEHFVGSILDPACGEGTICKVAKKLGFLNVYGSDIVDRDAGEYLLADFMSHSYPWTGLDNIIVNPPFDIAQLFIEKALTIARFKVAALLPLAFLESQKRQAFFRATPLARVLVFTSRVSMPPGNSDVKATGGTKAFAWFVWDKLHIGSPTVGWCHRPKGDGI